MFSPEQRSQNFDVVRIESRFLLEAKWYPVATMLGQSIGSVFVGLECFARSLTGDAPFPDIFCDTTGAAFTYVAAKLLFNCAVIPYVHYPTISADMLAQVREMRPTYNNNEAISGSATASGIKLWYYKLFAFAYSLVLGTMSDVLIANGSWTEGHLRQLLVGDTDTDSQATEGEGEKKPGGGLRFAQGDKIRRVFPPCNTETMLREKDLHPTAETRTEPDYVVVSGPSGAPVGQRQCVLLSIGQFRPEKDHLLQIQSFHHLLLTHPHLRAVPDLRLVLIGSARNAGDGAIVKLCRDEIERLSVSRDVSEADRESIAFADRVELRVNVPYEEIVQYVHRIASVGLHTMWNEHFGISVVEMQAAGLLTIAHASGGPKMDIVTSPIYAADTVPGSDGRSLVGDTCNGFLAASKEEYATCMAAAVTLTLRHQGRKGAKLNPDVCKNVTYTQMLENAAASVNSRFSDETFRQEMCDIFAPFVTAPAPTAPPTNITDTNTERPMASTE